MKAKKAIIASLILIIVLAVFVVLKQTGVLAEIARIFNETIEPIKEVLK